MKLVNKISLNVLVVNDSHVMSIQETKIGYEEKFNDLYFVPHVEEKTYVINEATKKVEPCVVISNKKSYIDKRKEVEKRRIQFFNNHNENEKAVYMSRFEPQIY